MHWRTRLDNDKLMMCRHPENIFLAGSVDALKDWLPQDAIRMNPAKYPIWSGMSHRSNVYMCLC
jgi:hypothetical protein